MSRHQHIRQLHRRRMARRRRHVAMAGVAVAIAAPYLVHPRVLPEPVAEETRHPASMSRVAPMSGGGALGLVLLSSGTFLLEPDAAGSDGPAGSRLPLVGLRVVPCASTDARISAGDTPHGHRR